MSWLIPHGGYGQAPTPIAITQTDESVITTNATGYTYSSQAIGTASDDRIVVVVTNADHASATATATIGGDAMTKWFEVAAPVHSFFYRAVPSGTTAEIIVTMSTTVGNNQIGVYAVTGASTTLHDTARQQPASGNVPTVTIDVAAAGGLIANSFNDNSATTTWSGVTEDYEQSSEASTTSGAHDEFATAETGRTVSSTPSSTSSNNLSVAVISIAPV